ncbi:MAG: D-alanine--D-alanine ligase [Butyrivibrio sp.]|uniref:D-alanine--D-alanine ligase family protein n=1 Tax=Butyrivibrio sp. LB2008 TaxID=1408305 RepID=UPI00047B5B87|nr:D-alanine--D-alanine ligase family protein [Butyrivibrio sp. LB2008]MCR4997212.1 D-alanine--D-alanine ligase [Butyrivibrio sp.]MEE3494429.1 D-alanine--D-alanine ligase family protein [Butyrivibrio sp.]
MKLKVAVLFGGKSTEHEISIISAIQAIGHINKEKYDVVPVYITKNNDFYVGEDIDKIEEYTHITQLLAKSTQVVWVKENDKVNLVRYPMKKFGNNVMTQVDVAFPIVHGTNVEDGTLQGFLATLGLPVVGCDVLSSAVGMNKYVMKTVLKDNNIPVLDCKCYTWKDYEDVDSLVEKIEKTFEYPVIIKPLNLGSSIGIKKASDRASLLEALDLGFEFSKKILVEHAISKLKEINCSVLGDYESAEASECEEPINSDEILSFEDKYIGGGSKGSAKGAKSGGSKGMASLKRKIPADISDEMRDKIRTMAVDAFIALGCSGVSRIDFMIDMETNEVYFNEINTIPGSLSFYLWEPLGMKYEHLLDNMIELALKADRENHKVVYSFETNVLEGVKLGGGSKGSKG